MFEVLALASVIITGSNCAIGGRMHAHWLVTSIRGHEQSSWASLLSTFGTATYATGLLLQTRGVACRKHVWSEFGVVAAHKGMLGCNANLHKQSKSLLGSPFDALFCSTADARISLSKLQDCQPPVTRLHIAETPNALAGLVGLM